MNSLRGRLTAEEHEVTAQGRTAVRGVLELQNNKSLVTKKKNEEDEMKTLQFSVCDLAALKNAVEGRI